MANPYYWDFPKRADTMYMSTICTIAFIQKINLTQTRKCQGSQHFCQKTSKVLVAGSKFLSKSDDKIITIQRTSSHDLISQGQSKKYPIRCIIVILKDLTLKLYNSRLIEL